MIYLLKVSVCSLLFYLLFYMAYRKKSNHTLNRFYLLSALLLSFVLPLIQIPIFPEYITVSNQPGIISNSNPGPSATGNFWNFKNGLLSIYLLGFLLSLGLMFRGLIKVYLHIQKGDRIKSAGYTKVVADNSFALSSFFNYLIVPQSKAASITAYELTHELVHIKQKHSWDILFVEFAKAVLWFNPIIHAYKKSLIELHEYLADATAIEAYGKNNYAAFLIQQISISPQSTLVHNFYSLFKKRLQMINTSANKSRRQYWLVLPVLVLACFLFSFSSYQVPISNADASMIMANDTIPELDTIITFDPATGEETMQVVPGLRLVDTQGKSKPYSYKRDPIITVDTVTTYDPVTKTEAIQIVRMESKHELDTITTFDSETFKQTIVVVDPNTGLVDTLMKEQ